MGLLAVFGITNDGLNLAVNLLLLFLVVFWIALVYWTYADARRRIEDPMLVGCAAAASMFPFLGTIVYLIVRPPEYLEDVRERELEIAAAEARLASLEHGLPALRLRGRARVPALPQLPAPAQGAVRHLRQAAGPALEDLPVLRGRGGRQAGPARARREQSQQPPAPGATSPAARRRRPTARLAAASGRPRSGATAPARARRPAPDP